MFRFATISVGAVSYPCRRFERRKDEDLFFVAYLRECIERHPISPLSRYGRVDAEAWRDAIEEKGTLYIVGVSAFLEPVPRRFRLVHDAFRGEI